MSKIKFDFDLKKKIVFKLVSEVLNLFEVKDIRTMIEKKIVFYDVLRDNMPELLQYLNARGHANKVTKDYVMKLLEPENIDEFIEKYTDKFHILIEEVPETRQWLNNQITHFMKTVWNV